MTGIIQPREYQLEALDAAIEKWRKGVTRQLLCLPTGCGKTIVFALLAKELNLRTLVLAHTEELIAQAVAKFKVVWPSVDVGVVKAKSDDLTARVIVASVQTLSRNKRLQRLKDHNFGLMIIDEAHHATAPSYLRIVKELSFLDNNADKLLLGVTATPKRSDNVGLSSIFQEIAFERSIHTMIRAGYLSPLVGKQVFTKVELKGVGIRNGDFIASELSHVVNTSERNQLIVDNYKLYGGDWKKSLAFCADVQHAKDLADTFNSNGISAGVVHGAMEKEKRRSILQAFSNGEYRVLTNCMLLVEGFDEPSIDCIIMGRPTQSTGLFTQMIGRGTRTFPLKRDCLILDFTDNSNRHDLCCYKNTLDGAVACLFDKGEGKEVEDDHALSDDKMRENRPVSVLQIVQSKVEDIDFFGNSLFAWTPIGDSWHLKLAANRDVWVRRSDGGFLVVAQNDGELFNLSSRPLPLDYALGVAEDWSRKQTTKNAWARKNAKWRSEPASAKQIEALRKLGHPHLGISKGEASQLLDIKFNEPATPKQIYWLKRRGIQVDPGITKTEARQLISKNSLHVA